MTVYITGICKLFFTYHCCEFVATDTDTDSALDVFSMYIYLSCLVEGLYKIIVIWLSTGICKDLYMYTFMILIQMMTQTGTSCQSNTCDLPPFFKLISEVKNPSIIVCIFIAMLSTLNISGGDFGNREDKINELLRKMV